MRPSLVVFHADFVHELEDVALAELEADADERSVSGSEDGAAAEGGGDAALKTAALHLSLTSTCVARASRCKGQKQIPRKFGSG
jgi:hypothetical protein